MGNPIKQKPTVKPVANGEPYSVVRNNQMADDFDTLVEYFVKDLLKPAVSKLISDLFKNGIDIFLYHEVRPQNTYKQGSIINYNKYSQQTGIVRNKPTQTVEKKEDVLSMIDRMQVASRKEAENVIEVMYDILDTGNPVSVADYLTLMRGNESNFYIPPTTQSWGWRELPRNMVPHMNSNFKYFIKLPRPEYIGVEKGGK